MTAMSLLAPHKMTFHRVVRLQYWVDKAVRATAEDWAWRTVEWQIGTSRGYVTITNSAVYWTTVQGKLPEGCKHVDA